MSFSRVKPSGWVDNELITPAQLNQLDTNVSNAVDGAGGGNYTGDLSWDGEHEFDGEIFVNNDCHHNGDVTLEGAVLSRTASGRIRRRVGSVGNADADITMASDRWLVTGTLTADRTYTVRHTGAEAAAEGDEIFVRRLTDSGAFNGYLEREDTSVICRFGTGTRHAWAHLLFTGGQWIALSAVAAEDGGTLDIHTTGGSHATYINDL